jgi:Dolichyl-phosphate-mannose-protein mannosyltransferase
VGRLDSFAKRVVAIAAAGFAVRVLYAVFIAVHKLGAGDFWYYNWSADLIARGKGLTDPVSAAYVGHLHASATHPPLWPYLLAIPSWLGGTTHIGDFTTTAGYMPHRIFGCLVGAVTIVLIGYLGRRVGGQRTGLLAAGVAAVYLPLISVDASTMSETLYGTTIALALIAAYRVIDRPTNGRALALGAAIGLAALTRSEALLLVPLLVLPLAWRLRPTFVRVLVLACAGTALVCAPWTIRNWIVFDQPVVISTNEGGVWAGANCSSTYYGPGIGTWNLNCVPRVDLRNNEAQESDRYRRKGIDYLKAHVGRLPAVLPIRLLRTWNFYRPGQQAASAEAHPLKVEYANTLIYFLMLPLAGYGILLYRRRGVPLIPLVAPFAMVSVVSLVLYGYPRFWHAAQVPFVVLAAGAMLHLFEERATIRRLFSPPIAVEREGVGAG